MIAMKCGDALVGQSIVIASTFGSRFMGLMFRRSLPMGAGLLLMPCGSIHMCFMRIPLDVVYLNSRFRVLGVQENLKPWRLGAAVKGTKLVLELPVGTVGRCALAPGMTLETVQPATAGDKVITEKRESHGN